MAKTKRTLDEKVRKYRIVVHNLNVTDGLVRGTVRKELGRGAEVKDWDIERVVDYRGTGPYVGGFPQRETIVTIDYQEYAPISN